MEPAEFDRRDFIYSFGQAALETYGRWFRRGQETHAEQ
jgi:hypothetical protein